PIKLEDNPSYLYYGGEKDRAEYREGVFVGYRYYDKKRMEVLFPFGHGLSYTTFEYSNMKADKTAMKDDEMVTVSLDVTNTGKTKGKEVVQIYVEAPEGQVIRPVRELREFAKVELEPGETKTVEFILGKRAFSYYHVELKDWFAQTGTYLIHAGASSRDLRQMISLKVESTGKESVVYHLNSTIGDILSDPDAAEIIKPLIDRYKKGSALGNSDGDAAKSAISQQMDDAMFRYMPLRQIISFAPDVSSAGELQELVERMNHKK
ncbi:MAG: glycosyl hydrolase, partial [Paenibacillaceae bacterium]|nr:glycosyl hydrolase [Paenibacillaceae bacterium]